MFDKVVNRIARTVLPKYQFDAPLIIENYLKRLVHKKVENKFLFILSPPYCGSTLLNELLCTSKYISTNNEGGTREGQTLASVREHMFTKKRWDPEYKIDWAFVKQEWLRYWDVTKPILLDKSPANIIRAAEIATYFEPTYFLITYRNPYAHIDSLLKRTERKPTEAAKFAIKCLKYQRENIEQLENSISFSYEALTNTPKAVVENIIEFVPELASLDYETTFHSHNFLSKKSLKITNLNALKIKRLSFNELREINLVFEQEQEILHYFGYELIENHALHMQ